MCPKIVRTGTMKIPLAIPSIPPSALVAIETANSHRLKLVAILGDYVSDFKRRARPILKRTLSRQSITARHSENSPRHQCSPGPNSGRLADKDRAAACEPPCYP